MFGYLRLFLTVALLAGLGAGLVNWGAHMVGTTPLILQAEVYEKAGEAEVAAPAATEAEATDEHHHDAEAWEPADGWERNLFTLGADIVTGVGFAFLLTAAIVVLGKGADWRRGILWGLAGFACFTLAPSLGLPPELPGTEAAPLVARQLWWIGTVIATAGGLFAAARLRNVYGYAIAVVLIAAPHIIGAPQPEFAGGLAPEGLEHKFVLIAIATSLVFWLVLGVLTGAFFKRYANEAGAVG
ncbi:MAG TPA: CbtA family protein [Dongiaceae bacterium]|jgi:cobalt transporter subunit CbtA|nr:CbtA family protein [Dongiaceae bacterium]